MVTNVGCRVLLRYRSSKLAARNSSNRCYPCSSMRLSLLLAYLSRRTAYGHRRREWQRPCAGFSPRPYRIVEDRSGGGRGRRRGRGTRGREGVWGRVYSFKGQPQRHARRPSRSYNAGTEHVGFSPIRQASSGRGAKGSSMFVSYHIKLSKYDTAGGECRESLLLCSGDVTFRLWASLIFVVHSRTLVIYQI